VLAEQDIEEPDVQAARRSVELALALFASGNSSAPEIEIWDQAGSRVACIRAPAAVIA
jgi:hypothetical protein